MNKVNQLIKELCPNGIPYKRLGDVGSTFTGLSGKSKNDFINGNCKYITYTNIYNNPEIRLDIDDYVIINDNENQNKILYGDVLIAGSSENLEDSGMISVVCSEPKENIYLNSFCFGFRFNDTYKEKLLPDFLKHFFRSDEFRNNLLSCSFGVTRYNLNKKMFLDLLLPIPPLDIQREIVKILDKFMILDNSLKNELIYRNKQYVFWRSKIISKEPTMMKIKDICNTMVGGDVPKNSFSKEKTDEFSIPIYSNSIDLEGLYGYTNIAKIDKRCVTLSGRGAGVGHAFLRKNPFFPIIRLVCLIPKEDLILADYLYYAIQLVDFKIPTTGIPQLTVPMISEYEIPVPPIKVQEDIVKILNKFDKLINDKIEGIPGEIALRQQQYEYYRNKFLNFERMNVNE